MRERRQWPGLQSKMKTAGEIDESGITKEEKLFEEGNWVQHSY